MNCTFGRNLLPCFLENAFNLVGHKVHGRPGDYYLDRFDEGAGSHLYVVAPSAPTDAVLPQSVGLLVLTNVSDFEVTGLALNEATWQLDENGYTQAQAGTYMHGPACGSYNASDPGGHNNSAGHPCPNSGFDKWAITPASVAVHGGQRVRFRNCTFSRLGASGVAFDRGEHERRISSAPLGLLLLKWFPPHEHRWLSAPCVLCAGSQNCSVEACLLEDISGNGVQIGTIDSYNISDPSAQDADNVVVDSVVRGVVRTTGSFHP